MSENNRRGKRTARERMQAERARQKSQDKRRRMLVVLAAVVGVLAVVAVVGVLIGQNSGDDDAAGKPVAFPRGAAGKDRLALPAGKADAPADLTVYEDFRCPACGQFESGFSKTINELEDAGKLRTEYRLVKLIDGNFGGSGSLNSANAAACAQDAGKFVPYHDVLFRNQPPETDDAFADKGHLKDLAGKVDGLSGKRFDACVDDGRYDGWVDASDEAFGTSGHTSTPTVLLDGESIWGQGTDLTPESFKQLVEDAGRN
ncbi:thioredoxin domain-containing protein [Streptomyces sp. WMMC500]|uniref:DsbA family protein n=1 Tax=Streptomyces sp. WMMC500 TaxID=3015154 RepID=UPI00248CBAFC|nr:thioredoxin domain-containing protein [Streptomyces sp. WMMC500]WBB59969.1 thioredoxin domain-containing protein [Streptomyces sp. WMMC500]